MGGKLTSNHRLVTATSATARSCDHSPRKEEATSLGSPLSPTKADSSFDNADQRWRRFHIHSRCLYLRRPPFTMNLRISHSRFAVCRRARTDLIHPSKLRGRPQDMRHPERSPHETPKHSFQCSACSYWFAVVRYVRGGEGPLCDVCAGVISSDRASSSKRPSRAARR